MKVEKINDQTLNRDLNKDHLNEKIEYETSILESKFPSSQYHDGLLNMNNINKNDLINITKEGTDAVMYLIKSIRNLIDEKSTFGHSVDILFTEIQHNLQQNIFCNYKNILRVYSENWLPIQKINGIPISKTRKRELHSLLHKTYSSIIATLLDKWMERIQNFINND